MLSPLFTTVSLIACIMVPALAQDPVRQRPLAPLGLGGAELFGTINAWSAAKEDLGKALFVDPILSSDRTRSCSSCHQAEHGFSSPEPFPSGVEGKRATRHAPTLYNRALGHFQMWDGAETSLEKQVLGPIQNPLEMNLTITNAIDRLQAHPVYPDLFRRAFANQTITANQLGRALAIYVRTLTIGNSPIDRFQAGLKSTLTVKERAGLWIYESRGRCWQCHSGPNFSDESFHNTGIGATAGIPELGRAKVTQDNSDRGRFKTPTLRGVAHTAPFMHDGSLNTLEDVVRFYNEGGRPNSHLSKRIGPLGLTPREIDHLVAFLQALSRE